MWEKHKRTWPYQKFVELAQLLEAEYKIPCIFLEKQYSFEEMMSLIKHCTFFVGNDSGPAIIAQSFQKKACVIFGAIRPEYTHMSQSIIPVYDRNRHKLCKHTTRQEEIDCCEEFCMERISVQEVYQHFKKLA